MKKWILILLALSLVVCFVSCKKPGTPDEGKDNTDQQTPGNTDSDPSKDEIDLSGPITEEMVRNYKVAPASDFEYEEVGGGVKITKYVGKDLIVVIPETIDGKSVVEVNTYLFANNSPVKGVWIPDAVKTLKYTFGNNKAIQVVICEGVEAILDFSFGGCSQLHTLKVGNNLQELGEYCISGCASLKNVYIPSSVVNIEASIATRVFMGCDNLTVQGEAGSYIESFCAQYNIPFEAK